MPETFHTPFPTKVIDFKDFSVELQGYNICYTIRNQSKMVGTDFQITENEFGMITLENTFMRFTDVFPYMREQMFKNIAKMFDIEL